MNNSKSGDTVVKLIQKFALKSMTWLFIYLLGYFDFSFGWLITPVLLSVLRDKWKRDRDSRLSSARQATITNEKDMIESRIRIEDLPSWVFFPDKVINSLELDSIPHAETYKLGVTM
jgi:hypothetical protein